MILLEKIAMKIAAWFMTFLLSFLSTISISFSGRNPLPVPPDDFIPKMRFTIASDVHLSAGTPGQKEEARLVEMIKKSYEISESDPDYKKLDAIAFAGDITNEGHPDSFRKFNDICKANIKSGTLFLPVLGNHDFFTLGKDTRDTFNSIFENGCDFDKCINGIHIIGTSKIGDNNMRDLKTLGDLKKKFTAAKNEDPTAPIFVLQHEHPFNTVYGSVYWGDVGISPLYSLVPQIIDFSGHSHYPVNDPRSIWQGTYTALGCGTLSYFEMEKDGMSGQFPDNHEDAAQFYVVEVGTDNSVRIRSYDLITNTFFGETRYIETPAKPTSFAYTYKNRKALEKNPEFSSDAKASAVKQDDGTYILEFDKAQGAIVTEYRIKVASGIVTAFDETMIPDYYLVNSSDTCKVNIGKLEDGKTYKIKIYAQNAYNEKSKPLEFSVTL